jgi:hypothetical protein
MSRYFAEVAESFGRGWNRFWFTPADPVPCAVLRIAVGLLAALHLASLSPDLDRWYGRDGLLSPAAVANLLGEGIGLSNYHFSYLGRLSGTELWVIHALAIATALAFAAGLLTRVSGALALAAVLAYVHRVPQVAGHVEPVLCFLLAYLTLAPSGAMLSLDRLLFHRSNENGGQIPPPSVAANIALRLIQVHLAMFVAMMGLTKLYGDAWWDGEAIWFVLAQTQSRPLDLSALRSSEYLLNFWTHAVLYYELAFPVLIWNRLARPLLVAIGVVLWISLSLATGLAVFGLTLVAAMSAFLPPAFFRSIAGLQDSGESLVTGAGLAKQSR